MTQIYELDGLVVNDGNDNYVFAKDVLFDDELKEAKLETLAKHVLMDFMYAANEAELAVERVQIRFKYQGKDFALHMNGAKESADDV